jgi:RNA polymerase sigma-70 factor (ECF subfamily)
MQPGDPELLSRISQGDTSAFETLYARYRTTVYNYLCYLESDRHLVQDLFQEVWLRVVRSSARADTIDNFRAWLFAVASNVYRDTLRRRRVRRSMFPRRVETVDGRTSSVEDSPDAPRAADAGVSFLEFREDLERALSRLTPRQRQVFVLKEIEGLKHNEVADVLGISVGACKSTLHHAVQALRSHLRSYSNGALR